MSLTGKRFLLLIILVALIITGLGTALMAQATQSAAPTSTGLVVAPSALDVPDQGAGQWAVALPSGAAPRGQLAVLLLQIEEAWGRSEWDRCIDILSVIVTIDPANALMWERLYQARVNYGWLLLSRQRFEEAHKQFSLALGVRPAGQEAQEGLRLLQQLAVPQATICPPQVVVPAPTVCPVTPPTAAAPCAQCTAAAPLGAARVYVVQRGDNLFRLALRFNVSVSVLMKVNGLQTTTIKAGQKLIIP